MNKGYICMYKGSPIYAMTSKEYIDMRVANQHDAKAIYAIVDKDNYLIQGNYVMGQAVDRFRKLRVIENGKSWRELLGIKDNIHRNPYESIKAKSEAKVITERPTVEAMATEGSKKLQAVLNEAPVAKASAEAKLNELVAEGNKTVEQVIAEGEVIRSAVESPVKRKRTNPSSRKRTSV